MSATEGKGLEAGDGSGDARQDRSPGVEETLAMLTAVPHDRLADLAAGMGDGGSLLRKILEIAAEEFGIEKDDQTRSTYRRKKSKENWIVAMERAKERCEHSCSGHKELMSPKLWGALPPELLPLVFSHLPVEEISRLKLLNKHWQQTIVSDADFHRACSQVYPRMLCLITRHHHNMFWVRVLDFNCSKWHSYEIIAGRPDVEFGGIPSAVMIARCEDEGLVCFVTSRRSVYRAELRKKKLRSGLFFSVMNPLTGTSRVVPPLFDRQETKLVQIQVDRRTKEYMLFVAAEKLIWTNATTGWTVAGVTAQIYDSVTGEWTTADESLSSNVGFRWKVAYNFVNGRLFSMDDGTFSRTRASAFHKEHLFVLKLGSDGPANNEFANQSPTYFIEEFHWGTGWVKAKTHRCEPFENPPKADYNMILRASNGFLMATAELSAHPTRFGNQLAWLYDLSSMRWSTLTLPELPMNRRKYGYDSTYSVDLMFEPQWGK